MYQAQSRHISKPGEIIARHGVVSNLLAGVAALWLALQINGLSILALPLIALALALAARADSFLRVYARMLAFFAPMVLVAWPAAYDEVLMQAEFHWMIYGAFWMATLSASITAAMALPFAIGAYLARRMPVWAPVAIVPLAAAAAHLVLSTLFAGIPSPVQSYFGVHPFSIAFAPSIEVGCLLAAVVTGALWVLVESSRSAAVIAIIIVAGMAAIPSPASVEAQGSITLSGIKFVSGANGSALHGDVIVFPESSMPELHVGDRLGVGLPRKGYVIAGSRREGGGSVVLVRDGVVVAERQKARTVYGEDGFVGWLRTWRDDRQYGWIGDPTIKVRGRNVYVDALICIESLYPQFARQYVRHDGPVVVVARQALYNRGWLVPYTHKQLLLTSLATGRQLFRVDYDGALAVANTASEGDMTAIRLLMTLLLALLALVCVCQVEARRELGVYSEMEQVA